MNELTYCESNYNIYVINLQCEKWVFPNDSFRITLVKKDQIAPKSYVCVPHMVTKP